MPKLLLADDSITVQRVIALTFAGEGLEVTTTGDGDRAVERIVEDRPDIVLADVSMPGRNGYGVAEFVKGSPDHAATTRVVLLTGAFEPVDEARTRALGIDGILAKPFEPHTAIELVKRLLDQPPVAAQAGGSERAEGEGAGQHAMAAVAAVTELAAGYPFEPRAADPGPPAQLDDYFRRLDEALSTAGFTPAVAATDAAADSKSERTAARVREPQPATDELTRPEKRPTADEKTAEAAADTMQQTTMALAKERPVDTPRVTLVDAFTALLAAEQGDAGAVAASRGWSAQPVASTDTDAIAETVTRKVLERLSDTTVREIVASRVIDVAERLVREEIERIKAAAEQPEPGEPAPSQPAHG